MAPPAAFVSVELVVDFAGATRRTAGWPGGGEQLVQDARYTMKGSAAPATLHAGTLPVESRVEADLPTGQVEGAVRAAPAHGLVRPRGSRRFSPVHNGRPLRPDRVLPADAPPPHPRDLFARGNMAGDPGAVHRDGPSPQTHQDTSYDRSSLADSQDTVFRAGADADPVVAHVYLDGEEDDAFAQELVAAGERTCFLHALSRSDLDVRLVFGPAGW
ncbi:MAG: hypothetical protein RMM30_06175 [Armatimonadota bacterium]|nr:hypothetical protein [Armatimonadota bacterium]MDW8156157.1 hypothetical protein [Armatimonadota bacterium]